MSWKEWNQGEIVEAGDFQEYIQDQVVQSYANASERNTTLGASVAEGMISYREDANVVEVYDGANWVQVGQGTITEVVAGTALTGGGTSGAVTLNVDESAITIPASQLSDVTATAAELNFTDGVTSNIQTQLDGKVDEVNGAVTTASTSSTVVRNITLATTEPLAADGIDGDVWLVYTA